MSANLATKANGQAALWLNGVPAWHHLGWVHDVERDGKVTVDFAMQASGLGDWIVEKRPMFYGATDESVMGMGKVTQGQSYATVRVNSDGSEVHLGTVGKIYKVFQNQLLADLLRVVTGQDDTYLESMGELAMGSTVFASMRLGEDIVLDAEGANDKIKKYLMVRSSHDGTGKLGAFVSPVRPVCTNTVNWAIQSAVSKWEIRHTEGGLDKIKEAERTLKLSRTYYEHFERDAKELYATRMSTAQYDRFVRDVILPIKADTPEHVARKIRERRDLAHDLFVSSKTNKVLPMNRWRAAMALTEMIEHRPAEAVRVPKSLRLDTKLPRTLQEDIAKGARIINGSDDEKKTKIHAALLTWKR